MVRSACLFLLLTCLFAGKPTLAAPHPAEKATASTSDDQVVRDAITKRVDTLLEAE